MAQAQIDSEDEDEMMMMMMAQHEQEEDERRRRPWVRHAVLHREELGEFSALWAQERQDPDAFHDAYRMSPDTFDEIANMLDPVLRRQDTWLRLAITPTEKLAVTLR